MSIGLLTPGFGLLLTCILMDSAHASGRKPASASGIDLKTAVAKRTKKAELFFERVTKMIFCSAFRQNSRELGKNYLGLSHRRADKESRGRNEAEFRFLSLQLLQSRAL